jgi:glycosyltransferase involved in cell wall biosynthesis
MRILFVLHTFPPEAWGGTELHVRTIARHLALDHEVSIFCRGADPLGAQDEVTRERDGKLEITRFNNLYRDYESFQWTWSYPPADAAFRREIESQRPDVVHIHHLTGLSTTIVHATREAGIPLVFSLHDFWMICPRGQRLHPDGDICHEIDRARCHECLGRIWPEWFPRDAEHENAENHLSRYDREMAATLGLADVLLTPSEFHRERMLEAVPSLDPDRIRANAHGLDHELFRFPHDPAPKPRVIGYIGTVIHTKGVHVLVEALNRLRDPEIELRIHGDTPAFHENAEYLSLLRERARGRVRFMGHYDNEELPELLREVDILVVPSLWWETFSLTIREAMLAGVPVVASDIGAMKEAVDTHGVGLLFRTGDPTDLARVLRRLIDDDELRRRCSNHRDRVKTIARNAADYLATYEHAARVALTREDRLTVNEPSFPKRRRSRRRQKPTVTESPLAAESEDVGISIEKIGEGEVRVQSAVERGEGTRVNFSFDYEPGSGPSEVRLVIDFKQVEGGVVPGDRDLPAASLPPSEADQGTSGMVRAGDADWDEERIERSMYMMDDEIASDHAEKLDELVKTSTLDDDEQVVAPRRDDDEDEEQPRRRRSRRRASRSERDGEDEDRGARREAEAPAQDKARAPRRERHEDRSGKRGRGRDEDSARRERAETGGRRRRDDEASPRRESKRDAKPAAKGKKPAGDIVWDDSAEPTWALPETSDESVDPKKKDKNRAPNHRLGRQPGLGGARDGSFGEGLVED